MALDSDFEEGLKKKGENPNAWMLTFADLLSLILTFFVMLYATQQVEKQKWKEMVESLSERLNPNREQVEIQSVTKAHSQIDEPIAINLDYLQAVLNEKFADMPEFSETRIRRFEDRLVISFPSENVFNASDNTLSENAKYEIDKLSSVLGTIGNRIEVASYVAEGSISNDESPWKYTLSQASIVANEFRRFGYMYPVAAFGFGDSRASDIKSRNAANASPLHLNRVDFVVREMAAYD